MTRPEIVAPAALANAPWLVSAATQAVLAALGQAGYPARVVGGAVRNALAGRPVDDIDISTPASPQAVMAAAATAGLASVPTGIDHGTVTVISGARGYEVTTLRRDVTTDGRRATVAFTDNWRIDAARRDLTMNALYCDADGTVHDPVGGLADLRDGRVRFIGAPDQRIAEDYLRILRFFRFHAEFGRGGPDPEGLAACVRGRSGMARLSAERVRGEMVKLLVGCRATDAITAMYDSGLLTPILGAAPRLGLLDRIVAAEAAAGFEPDAMLRLSALAIAVAEDLARLADRWRLSRAERDALMIIDQHTASGLRGLDEAGAYRRLYREGPGRWQRQCLVLHAISAAARDADARAAARHLIALARQWKRPVLGVRGVDVLALGVKPGPRVGDILSALENWWIENDFPPGGQVRERLAILVHDPIRDG